MCPQRKDNTKLEAMVLTWTCVCVYVCVGVGVCVYLHKWRSKSNLQNCSLLYFVGSRAPTWAVRHFYPLFSFLWIVFICLFYLGWWDQPQSLAYAGNTITELLLRPKRHLLINYKISKQNYGNPSSFNKLPLYKISKLCNYHNYTEIHTG